MITIDLGRGVFHALSSTLSLTLSASADVQLDPAAIDTKETELLQLVQSGEIWLTQAPEVKVQICISVQPGLAHYASTFFSQAGELLRSSKIWSDLGLAVLYKCCDHVYEKDESNCIRLSFGLRRMAGQSTSSKRRLPSTLQGSHEAVPPAGIPTARLSSVTVSLEYKSKEINKYTQMQLYTTPSISSYANSQHDNISGSPFPWTQFPPGKDLFTTSGNNTTASFIRELQDSTEDWTMPLHHTLQWNDDNESTLEFNKLLDIGLRSLITREPTGITNAIIKDMSTHLSELAPTLFSLGYTEAMNQRTQFIPSISKSITSIIQRKSPTRQKHPESKKAPSPEERKSKLKTHIKQSLWRIAQKQLFNPKASSNLTPLQATDSAFIPNDELLEYITKEDDVEKNNDNSDILISDEEDDYYLGTDEDEEPIEQWTYNQAQHDPCPIIDADKDSYYLSTTDTDTNTDDELLDFDFDTGNNQDSMSTICDHEYEHELPLPFPSPSTSDSCPRTSSSRRFPLQGISSESEMLTDPDPGPGRVDEEINQLGSGRLDYGGLLSDEVDMLSAA